MNDIVYEEQKQLIKMWKDKYCEKKEEIERLQSKSKKVQTILRTRARQNRKRKAKVRKYREELTNQRLKLERLNNIIDELEKWLRERSECTNFGLVLDKLQELKEK